MIRRKAQKILKNLNLKDADLSIVLCDDEFIKDLNKKWRSKDTATDVLSFPESTPDEINLFMKNNKEIPLVLGDIVISLDTADRQKEYSLNSEILKLFIHGFAHLMGYDHNTDDEEFEMKKFEQKLVSIINVK